MSQDIMDTGAPGSRRRWSAYLSVILAVAVVMAAVTAAAAWWLDRPQSSTALGLTELTIIGARPVTVVAQPPIGALATPAGTALPGLIVRSTVGGDPARAVSVLAPGSDTVAYVEATPPVTVPAGGFASIDLTIAPVDCALAVDEADLDESGYRWRRPYGIELLRTPDGDPVPMSPSARETFRTALQQACANAGPIPEITVTASRRGGKSPLETIGLFVDVLADADRLVLTPLDGPGLRGLGSADRRSGERIPLLWLMSVFAEDNEPGLLAYVQVFVVRDATAYPWIVAIPLSDDLPDMPMPGESPLTPLRSQ
jgi:hypothetical protein